MKTSALEGSNSQNLADYNRPPANTAKAANESDSRDAGNILSAETLGSIASNSLRSNNLRSGDKIIITLNSKDGQTTLEMKKDGVSTWDRVGSAATKVFNTIKDVVSDAVSADPAYIFKESALLMKDRAMKGVPDAIKGMAEQGFLPMIRGVVLLLDANRALNTFKNKSAGKIDKVIDAAHVATDCVGLAGAVALMVPGMSQFATAMMAVSVLGDVAAYGYHLMKYIKDKSASLPKEQQKQQPMSNAPKEAEKAA